VTRTRLETNGRTVRIALTPLGRTVAERWIPRAVHYENSATQGFSAEEVADLKSKLERVFLNLKSVSAEEDQVAEAEPPKVARRTRHPLRLRRARE
jgi:DNA-binding PadR family transcriptional regulator